jgi:hypothetical protein
MQKFHSDTRSLLNKEANYIYFHLLYFHSLQNSCIYIYPLLNENSGAKKPENNNKQAGAELRQAQEKLQLTEPALMRSSPI